MNTIKDKALVAQWREAKLQLDYWKKEEMKCRLELADEGEFYDDGVLSFKVTRPQRVTVEKANFEKARLEWFERFGNVKLFDQLFRITPALDKRKFDKVERELSAEEKEILGKTLVIKEGAPTIKLL